jgi:cell division protein FtsB
VNSNHHFSRTKKILIPLAFILFLLGLIFLPRPNGLISVLVKVYRIRHYRQQIEQLKAKADSLEQEIKLWQDPGYATRVARKIFARPQNPTQKTDND